MKLKISFNEIKDAIEQASYEHHYLIDKKNHTLIFVSELEDDYEKKLKEVESDDFISFEPRMPDDYFNIIESFVYEIQEEDFELAEKLHKILEQRKPFKHFKEIINPNPELREKWFKHRDKELANEAMNWLCINDIELEDKSFMPKFEIKRVMKESFGIDDYGCIGGGEKEILTSSECPKCKSKEIFEDF